MKITQFSTEIRQKNISIKTLSIEDYLEEMKNIQLIILCFLEEEENAESNFQNLKNKLNEIKIHEDQHKLMSLLHLITKIANNHHRCPNFIDRIERLLQIFQDDIKKYYKNTKIFNTFKSNKRILLFLIEHKIMIVDKYVAKKIVTTPKYINAKYPQYFLPEIKPFKNERWFPKNKSQSSHDGFSMQSESKENWINEINKEELPQNFYENRKIGENDSYICELIRNDSVEEFITHITKNNYSLNSKIKPSFYETNSFLLKKQAGSSTLKRSDQKDEGTVTFIQYAAFFGSIQIFKYLQINKVELEPSLWQFVIHSQNPDLIHLLEENHVGQKNFKGVVSYAEYFKESIKCHHNDLVNYIQNNLLQNGDKNKQNASDQIVKSYNFAFLQKESVTKNSLGIFCRYDYYLIVHNLLKNQDININAIQNQSIE